MTPAEAIVKMIDFYQGNTHDINHFLKVYTFAKTIAEQEGLQGFELLSLEYGAIMHDIACPLCREKYGSAIARRQEEEGPALVRQFFEGTVISPLLLERIEYLVGHHHTLTDIDGMDYQILLEADYLVNADESRYSVENIRNFETMVFKTETGKKLLHSMFL